MDVEILAVSQISRMVANCAHLKAFISSNDKTPFTDGYIDLYARTPQRKETWRGRVPVQVKGRTRRLTKGALLAHSIERTDLLAYQKDSGVLYFVVTVDSDVEGSETPYYALLSPFKIDSILNNPDAGRRKVSVPLTELPSDPNQIERIVALALKTRDQNVSLGFDPVLLKHVESLTLHTAEGLNFEAPITLMPDTSDFALVINTADGLSLPLAGGLHIYPEDYLNRRVDLRVRSGGITYEDATIRRTGDHTFEAEITDGLTFTFQTSPSEQFTHVSLTLQSTLAERTKALEFYLALLDTEVVEFNGKPSRIEVTRSPDAPWLRKHLELLRELAELFDHLAVDTHLVDLDQVDDTQIRILRILHRAFVGGSEVKDSSGRPGRVVQPVGQWHLMFLMSPGSVPEKWRLVDPFSAEFRQQFRWSADAESVPEPIPATTYDAVEDELLASVLNMRLDSIVDAYAAIADFPSTFGLANLRVLALISAADSTEARKGELLHAANLLNDWLVAEQSDQPNHLINRWQISWRQRELTPHERRAIRALRRELARGDVDNADQLEVACALLLGDSEEIDDLLRQLSKDRLQQMEGWPIWRLRAGRKVDPLLDQT